MHRRDDRPPSADDGSDEGSDEGWDDDRDDNWDEESEGWDGDDSADEPTVPCPYCRREILEDTPRCPSCGSFISAEDHAGQRRPVWVFITALICLGMAVWWAFAPA